MLLFFLLLAVRSVAPDDVIVRAPCPIALRMGGRMGIAGGLRQNACDAERALRAAGWSDAWVGGALTNAWFESGWDADAVSPGGSSVGFWQLHAAGLGRGMGDLRRDLGCSTRAVIRSAGRQRLRTDGGDVRFAARQFCQLIMRPSDGVRKGEQRASAAAHLSAEGRPATRP